MPKITVHGGPSNAADEPVTAQPGEPDQPIAEVPAPEPAPEPAPLPSRSRKTPPAPVAD